MPIIETAFHHSLLGINGHLETIVPAIFRNITVSFERERYITNDHDFIDIDFIKKGNKRILVLFHGLEGSSNSQYIKGFASYFNNKHWDIAAINFRSCSGETNKLATSYHSGKTEDIQEILNHINTSYNYQDIFLTGFSLGANVLLKWAADYTNSILKNVRGIAAISAPVDLEDSALQMAKFKNKLYMHRFLKSLNLKMRQKKALFPHQININNIHLIKNFHQFDNQFTAPIHGFKNAPDYYQKCSSVSYLDKIQLPTLLLNALNDPFLGAKCYPFGDVKNHPFIFAEFPKIGGHVGFSMNLPNGNYYSEMRVEKFLNEQIFN